MRPPAAALGPERDQRGAEHRRHLNATDVDSSAAFVAQSDAAGSNGYGKFSIDATGAWTYTMNSAHDEFVKDQVYTDSITVATADGTSKVLKVSITGTADGAVAAPPVFTGTGDENDFNDIDAANVATLPVNFNGVGNTQDTIHGSDSADSVSGNNGADTIFGNGGDDFLSGGDHADVIYGGSGGDTILGGDQADTLYGGSGADGITGNDKADIIFGGSGNDTIDSGANNDRIVGGYGADQLTGGTGTDTFVFLSTLDTGDTITEFSGTGVGKDGDKIDLSAIDANSGTGANDTFAYAGNTTTLSAHSLIWFLSDNGTVGTGDDFTVVQVDTDGNVATAELQVQITVTTPLVSSDFIL